MEESAAPADGGGDYERLATSARYASFASLATGQNLYPLTNARGSPFAYCSTPVTPELLAAAARADDPSTIGVLAAVAAGLGLAVLANRIGDRRARRRLAALGVSRPEGRRRERWGRGATADQVRARRGTAAYARWIVEAPGFRLRLVALAGIVAVNWAAAGAVTALMALAAGLLILFPLGYLGWRYWYWRRRWDWD